QILGQDAQLAGPRRSPRPPENLPFPLTPIVGRSEELDELAAVLADPDRRLVTVTGVGRVGKSRLTLELAFRVVSTFPDGVRHVHLGAVSRPEQVPAALAGALGVEGPGGGGEAELVQAMKASLRSRELLLLLDNFEHVLEAAAVVAELLAA